MRADRVAAGLAGLGFLFVWSLPARADDANYHFSFIGGRAAGMGGAYTAFSDSPDGTFYNPGGIVFAKEKTLSLSTNVMRLTRGTIENGVSIGSVQEDLPLKALEIVPTSTVALWPFENGRDAIALSFYTPEFVSYAGRDEVVSGDLSSFFTFRTEDSVFYAGPSYARKVTDDLGVGLSLFYLNRAFSRSLFITARNATTFTEISDGRDFSYGAIVAVVGAKWELPHNLHLGFSVRPPSIRLHGSGEIFSSQSIAGAVSDTNPAQTVFKDLTVNLPTPIKFTVGVGYDDHKRLAVSGDMSVYLPHTFDAVHDPQGRMGDIEIEQDLTLNGNIGVEYWLTEHIPLRVGFFTNLSSAPDPSAGGSSSKINFLGESIAIGLETKHTASQFGMQVSHGTGDILSSGALNDFSLFQITAILSSLYRF